MNTPGSERFSRSAGAKTPILVADDEQDVLDLIQRNLDLAGFHVFRALDGPEAIACARGHKPALIVLDVMLPGMSGTEVCRALKGDPATADIPILMLSARSQEVDRIVGLELGAEDYVTKPFSPRELVLRIGLILRRNRTPDANADVVSIGEITLDRMRHQVTVKGKSIVLTPTEYRLLSLLMDRNGRVQSRENLLSDVWGYDVSVDTRTVDIHVRRLREKLGRSARHLETVRGYGYRLFESKT